MHQAGTIQSLEFSELIVPAKPGVINSAGLDKPLHMLPVGAQSGWSVQFDQLPKLVLKMTLANGVVGIGEFYRGHDWSVVEDIGKALLGVDLFGLCLQDLPLPLNREHDGFECAIWDAFAKSHRLPLYQLLGGKVRERVKVGAWSSHRTVEEVGSWVEPYRRAGYDCIKFKCDLEDDVVAWCEAIAARCPGMQVILDPNERWENAGEARAILRGLERVGNVLVIEDPLPKWMYRDYADLRQFTSIRIVQHISLPYVYQGQRVHNLINTIEHRSVDGYNLNAGLAKFRQMDAIVAAANKYSWHGSEVDLGILEAMYLHQSIAAKSCIWPGDIFGRMIRSHDLLRSPLRIEPPFAYVPEGPGLGIELDEAAMAEYRLDRRTLE